MSPATVAWRWLLGVGRAEVGALRWRRPVLRWLPLFSDRRLPLMELVWVTLAQAGSAHREEEGQTAPNNASGRRCKPARHRELSVAVEAHFDKYGIDVPKVLQRYPSILGYSVERVERITSYLAGLGVDVKRAVEHSPVVLAGQVEKYEVVVELLRANRVDVARVVTRNPNVLQRHVATLKRTMAAIRRCNRSVGYVVDRCPGILRSTPADVASMLQLRRTAAKKGRANQRAPTTVETDPRVALLSSLRLDSSRLMRKSPYVLSLSLDNLHSKIDFLTELGVDASKVLHMAPIVFALGVEAIQWRVQFLSENGLDVERHVNSYPTLLCCSVERKLKPTLTFVLEEMGLTPAHLDAAPAVWGCSLEGRLRPRFLYLKSLDRQPSKLTALAVPSDKRFATETAGENLLHYYSWRVQNGYSVPPEYSLSSPAPPLPPPNENTIPING